MKYKIIEWMKNSPSAFQAVDCIKKELQRAGYEKLDFGSGVKRGGRYYITKNDSSIMALNIGANPAQAGFHIVASHLDCPCLKVKQNPLLSTDAYHRLNVEAYGGMLLATWFDRPLSIAGRLIYKSAEGLQTKLLHLKEPLLCIPSVAVHLQSNANTGASYNVKEDLLPLISTEENFDFYAFLEKKAGISGKILSHDLFLYPCQEPLLWGEDEEFLSAYHIDDMACAAASLYAFIDCFQQENINVYVCFDHEEVGSMSQQGADSNFLYDVLQYIARSLNLEYLSVLEQSMALSADNAHALHPNQPEYHDVSNRARMNKGPVIKHSARQSYTSDGKTASILMEIMEKAAIPYQFFSNRSDMKGGSTLGNISNTHVSLDSVDVGLAQLAMHSAVETAGSRDLEYLVRMFQAFYQSKIIRKEDGLIQIR